MKFRRVLKMMPRNSSPIIEKEVLCTYQIKLERVLGVTVSSNAALTCDNNGLIAYPAGCTVVLFNTRTEQQSHIINTSRKTITSLAFSSCGRYIVTGECGHQPAVRVWDLQSDPQSGHPGLAPQPQQVAEFVGHKFGVNCVAFSPTTKYVVSVGTQHDMIVNVWDWKNNIKVASNKVSTKIKSIAFSENGSYFVTVGNRHVKFWFLEHGKAKYKEAVPLMGRSAILGEQRNNYFCDVACGKAQCGDSTYAITRSGLLCEFNNRRLLDKWVELRTTSANCITVGEKYIFVGCAEGIIRCFDPATLRFITTLPRNHYLGVDVSLGTSIQHMATPPPDAKYPDTIAITFDETNNKLTSIYNDHSIYVWDVFNIQRVGKSFSFLYHSACIWGVEMAPPNSPLPPGSFLTCSSDDTIRVWTLDKMNENNSRGMYQPNIYSNELLKVVYIDKDLSYIKDLDISGTTDKQENSSYDGRNGVRCIRISPDGKHLASGDRSGNIRIHDTSTMRELCKIEAHDAEVLCLEYSDINLGLMASASRDRLLHVFDTKNGYDFQQTLDDHSSSITAVRFLNHAGNTQMVSCGADKSLIFRTLGDGAGKPQFTRAHNATGKTTLYDMEVDTGQKHVLTACQDRNVRIYSVNTGKHTKSFKGSTGDDGTLIKVVLDRSGIYLATSCTDKSLSVYDYYSGECMATMCGHSELATGLRFTNDCRRLISASGDGCIFVWRVPHDMVVTMHARLSQQAMRQGKQLENEVFSDSSNFDFYEGTNTIDVNYRFSIGQLPQWAKKQLTEDASQPQTFTKGVAVPKGRWAQRAENAMGVKSFYSNSPYPFPPPGDRRFDSDGGSKDSSLDSGTEIKNYQESRREISMSKVTTRIESRRGIMTDDSAIGDVESTAHDGDIDSDMEYRHRPIYYPTQSGTQSGSEFTVTNIDADELRKSQRKKKPPKILIQQATSSTYGSNDSDDDDDDASTPSGENTDRNPMSLFSISSESLDQLVSRERYLQSTFESMSGMENEVRTPTNKSSISSKFLTRTGERNLEAINAVKQTKCDPDAIKKRQELNKRIAETKKKLESVGHSSPLKYSQSIHDLSHIPERDRWSKKQGNFYVPVTPNHQHRKECFDNCSANTCHDQISTNPTNAFHIPQSASVPTDLQLCGCYMRDIAKNTSQLSHMLNLSQCYTQEVVPKSPEKTLNDFIRPRKLQLDKTLAKYKLHKSLPVSPVSEERSFSDYVEQKQELGRKSFSYFIDFEKKESTEEGFRQICDDIEKFSQDFNKKYEQIEQRFENQIDVSAKKIDNDDEDGNFSSDSLEEYCFLNVGAKKAKKTVPPRRCVSNNEIYKYQEEYVEEIPKSESFYLNPTIQSSQDSILSDELLEYDAYTGRAKSYCNSMESVISNESDCKSAPLEILFESQKKPLIPHSQSLPKNIACPFEPEMSSSLPKNYQEFTYDRSVYNYNYSTNSRCEMTYIQEAPKIIKASVKTTQTQTDFATPQEVVSKKAQRGSEDFQKKLLKFEQKKPIAFFVETSSSKGKSSKENIPMKSKPNTEMYIPSLASKNKQYKSRYCNVLNNKPEMNIEIFESGNKNGNFTLSTVNFEKNTNHLKETSSLDRHLFTKTLLTSEKVCHKPPKAVRRHSSKTRKTKTTYEYIRKEDFYSTSTKCNKTKDILNNLTNQEVVTDENTIELSYKEKIIEKELETGNHKDQILNELYDSLDKKTLHTKMEYDSLEVNINNQDTDQKLYDSLEVNVWSKSSGVSKNTALQLENVLKKPSSPRQKDKIAFALKNIKILNEIQRKIHKINTLVDIFKQNMTSGKVRALSSMYESMTSSQSYYNDLTKLQATPLKYRKRNLSLPSFVERRLMEVKSTTETVENVLEVSGKKNNTVSRSNSRYTKNNSITRSRSSTVLNQSDSDQESAEKKINRLMRPTISSHNKMSNKTLQNRKKHSYSTSNINTIGITENISTSDEESPTAPPRTRNYDHGPPAIAPRRHLNNKEKNRVSNQLCDDLVDQLTTTAERVVKLYDRLNDEDERTDSQMDRIDKVKMSMIRTHKILHDCIFKELKQNNGGVDVNQTDTVKKLNDLVSKGASGPNSVINIMEQFSDILLDMVQQKIHNSNI
nr:unnamed protein product [Callosobruchus analis]